MSSGQYRRTVWYEPTDVPRQDTRTMAALLSSGLQRMTSRLRTRRTAVNFPRMLWRELVRSCCHENRQNGKLLRRQGARQTQGTICVRNRTLCAVAKGRNVPNKCSWVDGPLTGTHSGACCVASSWCTVWIRFAVALRRCRKVFFYSCCVFLWIQIVI